MRNKKAKNILHIITGGTIGNVTEWYNFLLYGYLAPVISDLFFPSQNKLLSLTFVFTLFALSFLVRPLGGMLFGWIGDRHGRQVALMTSLLLMAIPTFLIGCLPVYATIGIASPILLCLLRICQGLSAGGEHTGSAVYIAEHAPPRRMSLWVSSVPASAAIGVLVSSLASMVLIDSFSSEQLLAWGWRAGYWAGTVLCLISILLRWKLPETPVFEQLQKREETRQYHLSTIFRHADSLKKLLFIFILASCYGIFYQILFIWMPTYLTYVQHYSHHDALQLNSIYIFLLACTFVCVGYVSDYINRSRLLTFTCVAMLLAAYPLFQMLASGSLMQAYVALAFFTAIFGMFVPTAFVIMVNTFEPNCRYTGLSFGFNAGLALFGGTCPLIATWLIEITSNKIAPAYYMMLAAACALLTVMFVRCWKKGSDPTT